MGNKNKTGKVEAAEDSNWLDDIRSSAEIIVAVAYDLEDYANAFSVIGNTTLATGLRAMSGELHSAVRIVNGAAGKCISAGVKQSEVMSATVLKAALAGAGLKI